ncbi:hypothetical protein LO771_16600 [Streptacidiphilus sp. ASG 303]|uniref:divisome protein SepX/GlpR n=1 Tax=Streptacidiphilus sp. ASG 303 TaxID=2896847 RepID=UPI001E43930A|nr:hypothetical protein [Streptacidiphilus sp. ASG 303]MCD0483970.1 hypothetical protein [Streptacidiphilus sp. ASG 303]
MSSSGLIYAAIVGAWAAYLVPMWLRRQDELNEARPTERFSTAIRLLSGRAAMERRITRSLDGRNDDTGAPGADAPDDGAPGADGPGADAAADGAPAATRASAHDRMPAPRTPAPAPRPTRAEREARAGARRRARLLARRRRIVTALFAAFTLGTIAAAVGGLSLLWAPAAPAVLLSLYIGRLRRQERLRYEVKLDRRRAAEAAQRLRERQGHQGHQGHRGHHRSEARPAAPQATARHPQPGPARRPAAPDRPAAPGHRDGAGHRDDAGTAADAGHRAGADREHPGADPAAERPALVEATEATDHEEWVDGLRERSAEADPDSWEPVPVPLPTYVTAPVAPRSTGSLDLGAPDAWSAGRAAAPPAAEEPRGRTPLFDQYAAPQHPAPDIAAEQPRPRAANE